jgi:hypothetical protein
MYGKNKLCSTIVIVLLSMPGTRPGDPCESGLHEDTLETITKFAYPFPFPLHLPLPIMLESMQREPSV